VARVTSLRRLSLSRCRPLTDVGLGCVAVGCPDLRDLSLRWCLGVTDLGLRLLALKCTKLTSLDLSCTMVSARVRFIFDKASVSSTGFRCFHFVKPSVCVTESCHCSVYCNILDLQAHLSVHIAN
jgi:hypothetical protein